LILTAITAGASRVASVPLCLHAVATTPAGPMKRIRSLLLHRLRPSPHYSWVGSCITFFEACSAFTRVTTCRLTESPYATLSTRGFSGFVTSTAAPIVTGWSDPVPGRVYLPLWTSTFSRRTVMACSIKGDVKNIFLPPPEARVEFATSSPSEHRRRSCGFVPWVIPSQQLHLVSSDDANQFRN
jgi:hypothetical protein